MVFWIILPITLFLVSFIGTWSVYGLALSNNHVCPLSDWSGATRCRENATQSCCFTPTISSSGMFAPESSLFSATLNAGSFLFLLFCIFHHAHVLEKQTCHSMLSKFALAFGVVSAFGSFAAGNCNAGTLTLLHFLGAGVSFVCVSFYAVLLTELTRKCDLTGHEKVLYPLRFISTVIQIFATIFYAFFYIQNNSFYNQLSAVFEWMLTMNMELFELSYIVEFSFFSSFMLSNLLSRREEEKPLMMT
ncbi:transmembrane protein 150A isoform X1 [Nothobranchius furzeri]|uniref:Transcript variant X1 n=2 Tax=Nothobranchius furzeri TaxID=105023 RepID=A0A9D3BVE8_NOTFU|nr:transmembrane protein 150A isoform X1 [Nothobranchius furzeri]KAF7220013.1 transcript variant X1 [Nothobranchius furzeri]